MSTRTIWGSCGLKFCKIFNFFWPISKKFVLNKTGEGHRRELTETFVIRKDILRGPFWRFRNFVDSKNKKHKSGVTFFFYKFVVLQWKNFCLWDLLPVHASVWQRLHLRAINLKWWPIKKYKKWCDFEKKEQFQWNRKTKFVKTHILLHETTNKNRQNFFQRGRRKIPQRTKLKLIGTGHPAAAGFIFQFPFLLARPLKKMKGYNFGGGKHQHLNF